MSSVNQCTVQLLSSMTKIPNLDIENLFSKISYEVEKILKASLDEILSPSPAVKIQTYSDLPGFKESTSQYFI